MKDYDILLEAHSLTKTVTIAAASPEEAATVAKARHCGQPQTVDVSYRPTWVEESKVSEATGELSMEYLGDCVDCGNALLNRQVPGQPWSYASADRQMIENICYACGMKRKAAGKYCPNFRSFYLRYCCPHDEDE